MTDIILHSTDARYANAIRIGSQVVGVNRDGTLGRADVALAEALNPKLDKARELRNATQLLPSELMARLDALRGPAIHAVHEHLVAVTHEGRRIRRLAATANFVAPTAEQPAWTQAEDIQLALRFSAMDVAAQTQIATRAIAQPAEYRRWIECLLRCPVELSGLDPKFRDQLRIAMLEQFDAPLLASIEAQLEQLMQAERAQQTAERALGETFHGALQELRAMPIPPEPPMTSYESLPQYVLDDLKNGGKKRISA